MQGKTCSRDTSHVKQIDSPLTKADIKGEEERNIAYYEAAARKYGGDSYQTVQWGSEESMNLRFAVLSSIDDLNGKSILDVGCGLGHLKTFLDQKGIDAAYTGIDVTPRLIDQCRLRFPADNGSFLTGSFLDQNFEGEKFDYVLISGVFAVYPETGFHYVVKNIEKAWSLCSQGVAFNSLSSWTTEQVEGEFHAFPTEVIDMCRAFTPWLSMRHDYHPRDFTVYMRRNNVIS